MSAHTDGRPAQIHLCRRTNIEAVSSSYDSQLSSSDSWTPYLELTAVSPALTPLCRLICSMAGASADAADRTFAAGRVDDADDVVKMVAES